MHCRSCEILIEDELLRISGVTHVSVSQKKSEAAVYYESSTNEYLFVKAIEKAGYQVGVSGHRPFFSTNPQDYVDLAICGVILLIIFFFANDLGLFKLTSTFSGNYSSLPIVFLIGLTAGFSTCMALVGGLVLGASARFAKKHPYATTMEKFKPHLFFNLGRIISYVIFGGIIGYAGSFFQISTTVLGILIIIVGLTMLLLGFQLTEIFPRLSSLSFTLPKSISRMLGIQHNSEKEYSHKNSMILGGLTFFLPCGFTQAMQLYAISSGSALTGALTMGVFALGTTPGLLGIGGLTSVIKGAFAKTFFKFAGLVVIALAIFNISNGYNLSGLNVLTSFTQNANAQNSDPNVVVENGVQVVRMTQLSSGYSPNSFTLKKGIPVRWIINSTDINTCAASLVSAKLGVRQGLQLGENIIEFTPQEIGQIRFSCIMGMYGGVFNVVDENGNTGTVQETTPPVGAAAGGSCGGSKGGCGGCGGARRNAQPVADVTPVQPEIQITSTPDKEITTQVLKATYTQDKDIQPNQFIVKIGIPVRLEIDAKESGYGCMGSMALPGLSQKIEVFTEGKTMIFDFIPTRPGRYDMTCAMGVPRGSIVVN